MGSGNSIHVANASSYPAYVLVSPNKDWAIADVVVGAAAFVASVASIIASAGENIW